MRHEAPGPARPPPRRGRRGAGPVRRGDRAHRRPGRRASSSSTRPRGCSTCDAFRVDVVTIFPEYLAPLRQSLLGKAAERGLVDHRRARPAAVDRRRPPHRRRRPLRRRPRHGHEARAVGAGAGGGPPARHPAGRARPRPAGRSPRRMAAEWATEPGPGLRLRPLRGHRPAGRRLGRRGRARSPRSPSATTCWPAGSPPSSSWSRRSPGCCPASSATASRSSSTRTPTGCSRARPTPGRRPGAGTRCRRCCCRGDHAAIARWRRAESLRRTADRRPDLLAALPDGALTDAERAALDRA